MRKEPLTGIGLTLLGLGIAVSAVLGPLVLGVIDFPISANMENQLVGGEIVSVLFAAPVAVIAGVLWLRGSRLAPALAIAPALYALYMYPQYIVGPEYSRYEGNSESAFPLYLALIVLGWATALRSWSALGESSLPVLSVRFRRFLAGLLILLNAIMALAWSASIFSALGGSPAQEYLADPNLFWLIRMMDLGFVIPAGLILGVGLLRAAPWASRLAYAFVGAQTLVAAAVAAMATVMTIRGDPAANLVLLIVTVSMSAALIVVAVLLLRRLQHTPDHGAKGRLVPVRGSADAPIALDPRRRFGPVLVRHHRKETL